MALLSYELIQIRFAGQLAINVHFYVGRIQHDAREHRPLSLLPTYAAWIQ